MMLLNKKGIMMLLNKKEVCANCVNKYQEPTHLGYDHLETHKCKANHGKECSDLFNSTCMKFSMKQEHADDYDRL